jgi:hypothetical protein
VALTHEQVKELGRPFPLEAHEWRTGRNSKDYVYITETAVILRLNEVDPSWTLVITDRAEREYSTTRKNTKTGEMYTLGAHELAITVNLTVCGVTRYGVGMAEIAPDAAEADKSAVTDALKRAARLFGVGGYLLNDPPGKAQFAQWLNTQNGRAVVNAQAAPEPPRPRLVPSVERDAPEPPAANGWTPEQANSFNLERKRLKVTEEEVWNLLGVKYLSQYAPGFNAADELLKKYAKSRPAQPAPIPDSVFGGAK